MAMVTPEHRLHQFLPWPTVCISSRRTHGCREVRVSFRNAKRQKLGLLHHMKSDSKIKPYSAKGLRRWRMQVMWTYRYLRQNGNRWHYRRISIRIRNSSVCGENELSFKRVLCGS